MATHNKDIIPFLSMATMGANEQTVVEVSRKGREPWLDEQLGSSVAASDSFKRTTSLIWHHFRKTLLRTHGERAINGDGNNPALPYKWYFHMAWWHRTLAAGSDALDPRGKTLLRHRVAQALSEILVISDNSILELDALGMADYYDILYRNAFGSYSDMLEQVSLHPCMGTYLTHLNNRKADPARSIHPDENYAREIMQLFTIGLYELNPDGSRKKGDIPTYQNSDIRELARVFTGLKASEYRYEWGGPFFPYNGDPVTFGDNVPKHYRMTPFVNMVEPMVVDETYHDRGAKQLLDGRINIPGGQSGKQDIRTAVRALVAHPNTAPFVSRKLIQQLVTSNPSRRYVADVARTFGRKGDMKAVVRAILLHPEAMQGKKLKSPVLRVTQLLRAFNVTNDSKRLWATGEDVQEALRQHPLSSPTVFNFYKPDFAPHGPIEQTGLVAPEFELHDAATSIAYINMMYAWLFGEYYPMISTVISASEPNMAELDPEILYSRKQDILRLDFRKEKRMARDISRHGELVDHISFLLTGKKNLSIKKDILDSFQSYRDYPEWVVQTIVFMIVISPEYTVLEGPNA